MQTLLRKTHYFFFVPLMHIALLFGLYNTNFWLVVALTALFYYPLHSLATVIGYHKLLSHRAFAPNPGLVKTVSWMSMLMFSGQPLAWAATHRLHHKYSDTDQDPHSPIHGRLHAYYTWLVSYKMPESDKFIVKDLIKEHPWMLSMWKYESIAPAVFYAVLFALNTTLATVILFAAILSFHKGMLVNMISHDPLLAGPNKSTDRVWLARLLSPTFLHRDHHQHSNKYDYTNSQVTDYSAWFIRVFLAKKV